jgi:hypothetical protein
MAALEGLLRKVARGFSGVDRPTDKTYAQLITRAPEDDPESYRWERIAQQQFATAATKRVIDLEQWIEAGGQTFTEGQPQPAPAARISPPN